MKVITVNYTTPMSLRRSRIERQRSVSNGYGNLTNSTVLESLKASEPQLTQPLCIVGPLVRFQPRVTGLNANVRAYS